jgi:hypothetical protein
MGIIDDIKQERSVGISARCDLVTLAELTIYWTDQGYNIKSVSQLVSWSLNLLKDALEQNEKITPSMDFAKAYQFMQNKNLVQQSYSKRDKKKIASAIRFEGMREEGNDPRYEDPTSYNMLHNRKSVEPSPDNTAVSANDIALTKQLINQNRFKKTLEEKKSEALAGYSKAGFTTESSIEEVQQRDAQQDSELDELINRRKGE